MRVLPGSSQQWLASKAHMTAATMHTQAKLRFHALHVLRGTRMIKYDWCFECPVPAANTNLQTRHLAEPAKISCKVRVKCMAAASRQEDERTATSFASTTYAPEKMA